MKTSGKGAIPFCPVCGEDESDLNYQETECMGDQTDVKRYTCNNCGSQLTELWTCKDWRLEKKEESKNLEEIKN